MTDATERDENEAVPLSEALGSANAAHIAHLTGMTQEAAAAYAAFHSGRWAQGPAGRRAA